MTAAQRITVVAQELDHWRSVQELAAILGCERWRALQVVEQVSISRVIFRRKGRTDRRRKEYRIWPEARAVTRR